MTIVEFLKARLDDDERIARAAVNGRSQGNWTFSDGEEDARRESERRGVNVCVHSSVDGARFVLDASGNPEYTNPEFIHVATFDPARMLREVAAKRGVIEGIRPYVQYVDSYENGVDAQAEIADFLKPLAAVYSDHPDYQEEWRAEVKHSRETVKAMRELRAGINYEVSDFVGANHRSDQITRFKNKIVRLFAEKAQAEQFDLRAFDIEFSSSRDVERDQIRLVGAWKPKTMEAEFVGGPLDGDIREVQSLDKTITANVVQLGAAASPFILILDREASPRLSVGYVLSGWDDVEHRWIFSPA